MTRTRLSEILGVVFLLCIIPVVHDAHFDKTPWLRDPYGFYVVLTMVLSMVGLLLLAIRRRA